MDFSCGNYKIVEAKDGIDKRLPIMKEEANKYLENDIDKLFEAINIRTSKSLDLTYSRRNASKKPIAGSNSPGIGFSELVSLKQAFRGLCVSQASETAAAKRLSIASLSPRISEKTKITNLPLHLQEPMAITKPPKISAPKKETSGPSENAATSLKVPDKATPKLREQPKLKTVSFSSSVKTIKGMKSTRRTSRGVHLVMINKNFVINKSIKLAITTRGNSNRAKNVPAQVPEQLICQKCECYLRKINNSESVPNSGDNKRPPVVKITKMPSKSSSKGSSIADYSSSTTTSFSEESNLSGSIGNRPHMSKDVKWGAITRIREQCGFVGLTHFNLIKKLGAGDIGTVYLAELIGTRCSFAIKVMDNDLLGKRKKMARAQTDREILGMLDHPFLPTLYAQFVTDNLSCLVMEFCPGGDLHVLRQKQPGRYFPEQAARFYAAEVLLALEYLHMLGIIYRDLKPENILVREDGHIMLTDFDLSLKCSVIPTILKSSPSRVEPPRLSSQCTGSNCIDPFCSAPSCKFSCFSPSLLKARNLKKLDSATKARSLTQLIAEPNEVRSNSFVGTHEYLAPEIIKCEGHGSSVDWWTFGVFLYELLYGKTPFKGGGNDETLVNVVKKSLKFPNTSIVSFQARDLIRGLLVKEPENRFGTETGAAEIKRHPFFKGLNWALIRCAVPPQIPEICDFGNKKIVCMEKAGKFMDCNVNGGHVEFELF